MNLRYVALLLIPLAILSVTGAAQNAKKTSPPDMMLSLQSDWAQTTGA